MTCLPKRVRSVPVGSADLFNQSVEAQALKQPGDFPAGFVGPLASESLHSLVSVDKYGCIRERAPVEPGTLAISKRKSAYME